MALVLRRKRETLSPIKWKGTLYIKENKIGHKKRTEDKTEAEEKETLDSIQ